MVCADLRRALATVTLLMFTLFMLIFVTASCGSLSWAGSYVEFLAFDGRPSVMELTMGLQVLPASALTLVLTFI